jgi:hypothetical protein
LWSRVAPRSHSHLHRTTKIECLMPARHACFNQVARATPPICLLTWQLIEALLGRCHGRVASAQELVGDMVGHFRSTSLGAPAGGGCCTSVAGCHFDAIPFPHSTRQERGTVRAHFMSCGRSAGGRRERRERRERSEREQLHRPHASRCRIDQSERESDARSLLSLQGWARPKLTKVSVSPF